MARLAWLVLVICGMAGGVGLALITRTASPATEAFLIEESRAEDSGGAEQPKEDEAARKELNPGPIGTSPPEDVSPFLIACSATDTSKELSSQPWLLEARVVDHEDPMSAIVDLLRASPEELGSKPTILPLALLLIGMEYPLERLLAIAPSVAHSSAALRAIEIAMVRRMHDLVKHEALLSRLRTDAEDPLASFLDRVMSRVALSEKTLVDAVSQVPARVLVKRLEVSSDLLRSGSGATLRKAIEGVTSRIKAEEVDEEDLHDLFAAASRLAHAHAIRRTVVEQTNRLAETVNNLPAHKLNAIRASILKSKMLRHMYRGKIAGIR